MKLIELYSVPCQIQHMRFRSSKQGTMFDWHCAPQAQYIIYLKGNIEVIASGGETRQFKAGDILFANDTTGKGHISKILSDVEAVILVKI